MSENNLFQFAQVIAELPIQNTAPNNSSNPSSSHQPLPSQQHSSSAYHHQPRYPNIRKNACVVCSICFTCSKYYGVDCTCQEIQPRRGKNLPEGGLDSRAKKLHRNIDQQDYEFSIAWIQENAHQMYKDQHDQVVVGLRDLSEVSLCKAHSSTLYRAKKRHERLQNGDFMQAQQQQNYQLVNTGGLAAKVKELSFHQQPQQEQQQQQQQQQQHQEMPDFSRMSHSTSNKRKRINKPTMDQQRAPNSSLSTPLLYTRSNSSSSSSSSFIQQQPPPISSMSSASQQQQQECNQVMQQQVDNFPSSSSNQLPPLHSRQQQLYPSRSSATSSRTSATPLPTKPTPSTPIPTQRSTVVIETVSLRSNTDPSYYYFRNLAITDTFTFRDLLLEIDMTGSPPPGKRIVISDLDKFYPLDQAIRSVIKRPNSTHLDLSLGLTDKPSINWSHYA